MADCRHTHTRVRDIPHRVLAATVADVCSIADISHTGRSHRFACLGTGPMKAILILSLCLIPTMTRAQSAEEKIFASLGSPRTLIKNWVIIADDEADWTLFLQRYPSCQQSKTACSVRQSHETHIRASFVMHAEAAELRHVLLHEAGHLSGRLDEAGAEWWANQHDH